MQQKCAHNAYKISALHAELGLRDIPGKSIQRSRQTERIRRLIAGATRLDPAAGKVIGILRSPRRLLLSPTQGLARRLAACLLSGTNSIVGTEPATADATRALSGNGHDEPSSPSPAPILSGKLGYRPGGSLLESTPGSVPESAEGFFACSVKCQECAGPRAHVLPWRGCRRSYRRVMQESTTALSTQGLAHCVPPLRKRWRAQDRRFAPTPSHVPERRLSSIHSP